MLRWSAIERPKSVGARRATPPYLLQPDKIVKIFFEGPYHKILKFRDPYHKHSDLLASSDIIITVPVNSRVIVRNKTMKRLRFNPSVPVLDNREYSFTISIATLRTLSVLGFEVIKQYNPKRFATILIAFGERNHTNRPHEGTRINDNELPIAFRRPVVLVAGQYSAYQSLKMFSYTIS
jgi:hypothetical protein